MLKIEQPCDYHFQMWFAFSTRRACLLFFWLCRQHWPEQEDGFQWKLAICPHRDSASVSRKTRTIEVEDLAKPEGKNLSAFCLHICLTKKSHHLLLLKQTGCTMLVISSWSRASPRAMGPIWWNQALHSGGPALGWQVLLPQPASSLSGVTHWHSEWSVSTHPVSVWPNIIRSSWQKVVTWKKFLSRSLKTEEVRGRRQREICWFPRNHNS